MFLKTACYFNCKYENDAGKKTFVDAFASDPIDVIYNGTSQKNYDMDDR